YNLTGVVDWDGAATAPLERLAVSPEFITFPGISDEKNQVILDFRAIVRDCLQELVSKSEKTTPTKKKKTTLSMILGSKQADITHRCTYSRPYRAIWDGQMVAKLIYGDHVSWEQLVAAYGEVNLGRRWKLLLCKVIFPISGISTVSTLPEDSSDEESESGLRQSYLETLGSPTSVTPPSRLASQGVDRVVGLSSIFCSVKTFKGRSFIPEEYATCP
ncbi:hypothetical protein E4U46_008048, partial [Claviceps purpurea]